MYIRFNISHNRWLFVILYAIIYLSISAKRGSSGVLLHWERTAIFIHLFYNNKHKRPLHTIFTFSKQHGVNDGKCSAV